MTSYTISLLIFLCFMAVPGVSHGVQEISQSLTFDGRAYSDTTATIPMLDTIVTKIQILNSAQDCILYEEQQTVNTTASNGYFTIQIGSAQSNAKRAGNDVNNAMSTVFSNTVASISGKNLTSSAACTYTPTSGDKRYVRLQMTPATDNVTRTISPNMSLDSVPSAMVAERAESIQGLAPANLLQVNAATSLTQANVENIFSTTNYTRLNTMLSVAPTNYVQTVSNGSVAVPSVAGSPGSGLAAGQIWYDSVANVLKYYDGGVKTLGTSAGLDTAFVNGGNSFAGAATLGTNDNNTLGFKTNNTTRMTIDATGKIGVGTSFPNANLEINSGTSEATLRLSSTVNAGKSELSFYNYRSDGSSSVTGAIYGVNPGTTFSTAAIQIQTFDSVGFSLETAAFVNGKVGVGTTSPGLKLESKGTDGLPASSGTSQVGALRLTRSGTNAIDFGLDSAAPYGGWLQVTNTGNLATTYPLLLNPNGGNVGIGTPSPGAPLHIVGTNNNVALNLDAGVGQTSDISNNTGPLRLRSNNNVAVTLDSGQNMTLTANLRVSGTGNSYLMGNVGVGTASPADKLALEGGTFTVRTSAGGVSNPVATNALALQYDYTNGNAYIKSYSGGGNTSLSLGTSNAGTYATRLKIDNAGNVGIGTTTPQATLDVSGYMRLTVNSSAPVACSATNNGAIALNSSFGICACKGSTTKQSRWRPESHVT